VTVAPLRAAQTETDGWGDDRVELPAGSWRELLTGREFEGGSTALADLLADWPVALLIR
jgi:(1->4)-alpha-D-glucan 1-alpha-D-glucosylmutase